MSDLKLGTQIEHENHLIGKKDAVHIAVVMCSASDDFGHPRPGQRVRFTGDAFSEVRPAVGSEPFHGVVDPFLENVNLDDLFLVIIKPGLASTVRHDYDLNITDTEENGQWDCRGCN
jgi:hypothetical protein